MTITIFTSNSLRHNHLINLFAKNLINVVIETKKKTWSYKRILKSKIQKNILIMLKI